MLPRARRAVGPARGDASGVLVRQRRGRTCDSERDGTATARGIQSVPRVRRKGLVPAIHADCDDSTIEVISAGASIGAFSAVRSCAATRSCSRPRGGSGTYDLCVSRPAATSRATRLSSPLHFLSGMSGDVLNAHAALRVLRLGGPRRESRRIVAHGARTRAGGDPEPRGRMGRGVEPRLAHVAAHVPALPRRADAPGRRELTPWARPTSSSSPVRHAACSCARCCTTCARWSTCSMPACSRRASRASVPSRSVLIDRACHAANASLEISRSSTIRTSRPSGPVPAEINRPARVRGRLPAPARDAARYLVARAPGRQNRGLEVLPRASCRRSASRTWARARSRCALQGAQRRHDGPAGGRTNPHPRHHELRTRTSRSW